MFLRVATVSYGIMATATRLSLHSFLTVVASRAALFLFLLVASVILLFLAWFCAVVFPLWTAPECFFGHIATPTKLSMCHRPLSSQRGWIRCVIEMNPSPRSWKR